MANTDRLQAWQPGQLPEGQEEHPLSSFERTIHVTPGWYSVTVVAGIVASEESGEEEWVCAFLLDPSDLQPGFTADLGKSLTF